MKTAYKIFLNEMGIENVTHQMTDEHAEYFDGTFKGQDIEIKVIHETKNIEFKEDGSEDWEYIETYDVIDDDAENEWSE